MTNHDCTQQGHFWCEGPRPENPEGPHGPAYSRRRDREKGLVDVYCVACPATAQLEGHAKYSGPRGSLPVDHSIPAPFMEVVERALAEAAANSGPVPKT